MKTTSGATSLRLVARVVKVLALCAMFLAVETPAAPLKVTGRFLQDAHGNNILMRGVNVPVYKSGYADDLDAVAAAIARTKTNVVRLEWWAVPSNQTQYSTANLGRAIQKFYDLGILPIVELHDLTFDYYQGRPPGEPNSRSNDRTVFENTITAFWTRPEIVALIQQHKDHVVVNIANEWGSTFYKDANNDDVPATGPAAAANFLLNYTNAIASIRNAGITAPLMVDAPKGFEYQFLLDHGQALLAADPQANTLLSVHAYFGAGPALPYYTDAQVIAILDALANSGLPIVLGEVSSNAYANNPCDPINYVNLLTHANAVQLGYLYWVWYEDDQCSPDKHPIPPGQPMNITLGMYGDGVTLPTMPGYPYDALYHPAFGIDTAQPPTTKVDFSPLGAAVLLNTSFGYNVTSTGDNVTRAATAQVTRLDNFGAEKRPVVVLMPGWGGVGDVAAVRDAQAVMFANQGYVAINIGFHQTNAGAWNSDLAESAKAALDALCLEAYVDCTAIVLTGDSYGGTQVHPVVRYLRGVGTYDGSGGANAGRKVVALLGQDSGYTLHWAAPRDADATAYSIAMIENLGDAEFPVDSCQFDNCGARNRADYHQTAPGSQYVLSYCPAGGSHGVTEYANWDAWVLSAVKTMLHTQRGVAKFTGYTEPALAVSNQCVTAPAAPRARLFNISTRMQVLTGNDVMIAGLIVGGPVSKTLVINVAGPSLAQNGIANPLANPTLTLVRSSDQAIIASNDNWQSAANAADILASGFAPNHALEPAIMMTLAPGAYTAIVQGVGGTGVGLVGVFEVDHPEVPLINISTRGQVLTGNDVMIAGFIVQGSGSQTVVINVAGPSLAQNGIANPLANPTLTLVRSSDQAIIASNDDWQVQDAASVAAIQASGFKPNHALEPAIIMTLAPGAYTAIVQGAGGGTGVGLVGVFAAN